MQSSSCITSLKEFREPEPIRVQRPAMGTMVHMVAFGNDEVDQDAIQIAFAAAFQEVRQLEELLSVWKPTSDLGRLNRAEGAPVHVSPETIFVMERARWASRISDGAFDVTFQVMSDIWRFGDAKEKEPRVPLPYEVAQRRAWIDYRKVEVNPDAQTIRLPPGMQVSLGGIGKGYVLDRAARILDAHGLKSFFIQAGGDLLSVGHKPSGQEWRSGVQDPRGSRGAFFATLGFSDHAFSTAGDYVHAYQVNGQRYHHIIDPRTGYPASACRSVTIWAKDAATADALDDAVFVLGPDRGLALVESLPGVGAVIVDANNRVIVSQRLARRITLLRRPIDDEGGRATTDLLAISGK